MPPLALGELRARAARSRAERSIPLVPDPTANAKLNRADKVGLILGSVGLGLMAYVWLVTMIAAGIDGANHVLAREMGLGLQCDFVVAAPVWIVLRTVDFVCHLPWARWCEFLSASCRRAGRSAAKLYYICTNSARRGEVDASRQTEAIA
jgi:hypothetical protein